MNSKILGFAGLIGVGKSALSEAVAARLGWKLTRSGQVLRDEATRRGLDFISRRVLQDLGQEYIDEDRENFCKKLLKAADWHPGENLIVDAIRHVEAIETLKVITAPSDFKLVYILLEDPIRRARMGSNASDESLNSADNHPAESQARDVLPYIADITINGSDPMNDRVKKIIEWVRTWS